MWSGTRSATPAVTDRDPVVVEAQQVNRCLGVAVVPDVQRGPTRIGVDVVWSGATGGDEFVTDSTGKWDVGLAPTMHVANRAAAEDEVRFPKLT